MMELIRFDTPKWNNLKLVFINLTVHFSLDLIDELFDV